MAAAPQHHDQDGSHEGFDNSPPLIPVISDPGDNIRATLVWSCLLSVFGSSSVILSYCLSKKMRQKTGRLMLVYLSVADLASAIVYLAAAMPESMRGNSALYCKVTALLDIYFPVASFLWTDCIGVFLWRAVQDGGATRTKSLLPYHLISWGLPLLCVGLVAASNQEGSPGGSTGSHTDITGGWCWVRGASNDAWSTLKWVLIGGKIVEWPSITILVPAFYMMVYLRVSSQMSRLNIARGADFTKASRMGTGYNSVYQYSRSSRSRSSSDETSRSVSVTSVVSQDSTPVVTADDSTSTTNPALSHFMHRLIAVPLVLLCARIWGNAHTVLWLLGVSPESLGMRVLLQAQAVFDPAQGLLNGIIFVGLSREARSAFGFGWCTSCRRRAREGEREPLAQRAPTPQV